MNAEKMQRKAERYKLKGCYVCEARDQLIVIHGFFGCPHHNNWSPEEKREVQKRKDALRELR